MTPVRLRQWLVGGIAALALSLALYVATWAEPHAPKPIHDLACMLFMCSLGIFVTTLVIRKISLYQEGFQIGLSIGQRNRPGRVTTERKGSS